MKKIKSLKDMEHVIIAGNKTNVYIGCFSNEDVKENSAVKTLRPKNLPCEGKELYAKDINALYAVNIMLKQIKDMKDTDFDNCSTVKIHVDNTLYKKIVYGYFKQWLNTGRTLGGLQLDAKELAEWEKFSKLYAEVLVKVTFATNEIYSVRQFKRNHEVMKFGKSIYEKFTKILYVNNANKTVSK